MAYRDLAIRLSAEAEHRFVASALEDGRPVASNSFEIRSDELKIIEQLRELEKAAAKPESQVSFHREFGQMLYGKVLAGDLKSYFEKQLEGNGEGLRISLQFDDDARFLATLPWEFLHDGEDFLVARRDMLISRMPSRMKRVSSPPLESVLRMLVIVSAPQEKSCAPLDSEKERDRILQAVDRLYVQQKMEVDFTDDATFETIQSYLNEKDYHIVHFTGHGTEVDGRGYLVLENEDLTANRVDNQAIADLFAGRGIRLVVLSACESADLADRLVRKGVPAVVAMQYSILDSSATGFGYSFYQALAGGRAIDLSLTEARLAMRNARESNKIDFATPVLYLLDPECLHTGEIRAVASEIFQKPVMLGDVQVMREGFVGRQKELRFLQKALLSGSKRAAIVHGWGGIGKTVLASRLALRMTRHFEGFYGHKCNKQTRAEDLLNGICAFLNLAGISALNQILYQPVPLQVKTAALVSILNQKKFLIILDNFESCLDGGHQKIADPELRQFIEHLLNATTSGSKFIITTRYDFDPLEGRLLGAIEHLSVPEMPLYQAVWLMNSHSNLAALDIGKKKEIYKAIGGHPWTIGMFAKHARAASVDGLLLELGPLDQELRDFTLFDKSYSELDGAAKELLRRASIFEEAVPVEALRDMMGDEKEASPPVDKPLDMLLRWGLVARQEEREETLYSVHTKVRDFVGRDTGGERQGLLVRAAQYYERSAKGRKNLWDLLRARNYYYRAGEWEKAADIVIAAWEYLARWGYIELALKLLNQSADTTSGTKKAVATGNLAILYQGLGDWRMALKLYGEVKEIFEGQGDRRNVAASLHQLGMVHQDQGNYPRAVQLYQQSLEIMKDLGDKAGIAASLHQLGTVHLYQGDYLEAVKFYQQSMEMAKELGDKSGIAYSLGQLGYVHFSQGNYPEAVKLYQQSLEIAKDLGDKSSIALALNHLGMIHQNQGNYSEAVKLYQQSLDILKDLGDKSGIARSLHQLGMVHQSQGNYTEAVKLYQQSLDILKDLGDKSGIARSLHQLGMVHQDQGNYSEAVKLYQQSLDIEKDLGDKSGIASSLHQLGNVHYQQGNYTEAVKLYEQSLEIMNDLGDKSGIAHSLHQLGMVHQSQGNYTEAVKLYQQSLEITKDLGDKSGIAISLGQMGRIKEESKDYDGALGDYLTALSIFEELQSPNREIVKKYIARLRETMGEEAFQSALAKLGVSL